jgi:hypothetical protein
MLVDSSVLDGFEAWFEPAIEKYWDCHGMYTRHRLADSDPLAHRMDPTNESLGRLLILEKAATVSATDPSKK